MKRFPIIPGLWLLWLVFIQSPQSAFCQQPSAVRLPSAPAESPQDSQHAAQELETLCTESIDVSGLKKRLQDEVGLDNAAARAWIENRVKAAFGHGPTELEAAAVVNATSQIGVETAEGNSLVMPLNEFGRGALVSGNQLLVVASRQDLQRLRDMLTTLEQFGLRQVVIRTHILRDTAQAMKGLPITWSHVEAASRIARPLHSSASQLGSQDAPQSLTAAALYLQRQSPVNEDLPPPAGVTSATWTEATSIVERATPVLYTLLDPTEYESVLKQAGQIPSIERIMSPTVVVFNGQVATISNSVERPFVTGIKPMLIGEAEQKQVEFAAKLTVYPEGTTMKVRPQVLDGSRIRLNCQLELCQVRAVETLEIPVIDGSKDFVVQMPEVASTRFRTCLEMPVDYALAVSAFETDAQGVKRSVVILCQCSMRNVE